MDIKKTLLPAAAALALALTFAEPGHAQLGVGAGLNFNDLEDIELGDTDATFDDATGWHFGAFVNLGAGPISFRPGVFYHRIGTFDFPGGEELELTSVEVPLDVRLMFAPESPVAVYLLAAPVLTFPRTPDFDDAATDMTLTGDVGGGIALNLGGLSVQPELRYSIGVTDYFEDEFTIGGATINPVDDDRRFSQLMLRLNVVF